MGIKFDIETNRDDFKKDVPPNIGGIYFLYNKNMELLYIGKAVNFRNRMTPYMYGCIILTTPKTIELFATFYHVKLLIIEDRNKMVEIERQYIKQYKPPCNTIGLGISRLPEYRRLMMPKIRKNVSISEDVLGQINNLIDELNQYTGGAYRFNNILDYALKSVIPELEKTLKRIKKSNELI